MPNSFTAFTYSDNSTSTSTDTVLTSSSYNTSKTLTNVEIGTGVTTLGDFCFQHTSGLTSIVIPDSITNIGSFCFSSSGLQSITIPSTVTTLGIRCFQYCYGLTNATVMSTMVSDYCFYVCNALTSVILSSSVRSVGFYSFFNCAKLKNIYLSDSIVNIGFGCFMNSGLTSISIPSLVTNIGMYAFSCFTLTSVSFNNQQNIATYGTNSFENCYQLANVTYYLASSRDSLTTTSQNFQTSFPNNGRPGFFVYNPSTNNNAPAISLTIPSKNYGDQPFTITAVSPSSSAFTYTSSNESVATISGNVVTIMGAGASVITASQIANNDFGSGMVQTTFIIKQAPSISNFSMPIKSYVDSPFTITPPTSNSSGTFSYISSNPSVATISGNEVTIVGIGSSVITATQAESTYFFSGTIEATFEVISIITPSLSAFSIPPKLYGEIPFEITPPVSNSPGAFTYNSANEAVATISGNILTIAGVGSSVVTATQAATPGFTSASIDATFVSTKSSPTNPVIIDNGYKLEYFLTTNAEYGRLQNDIAIASSILTSHSSKILFSKETPARVVYASPV